MDQNPSAGWGSLITAIGGAFASTWTAVNNSNNNPVNTVQTQSQQQQESYNNVIGTVVVIGVLGLVVYLIVKK